MILHWVPQEFSYSFGVRRDITRRWEAWRNMTIWALEYGLGCSVEARSSSPEATVQAEGPSVVRLEVVVAWTQVLNSGGRKELDPGLVWELKPAGLVRMAVGVEEVRKSGSTPKIWTWHLG